MAADGRAIFACPRPLEGCNSASAGALAALPSRVPGRLAAAETGRMWGWTNGGQGSDRRRAAARAAKMITLVTVLAAAGIGYLRSTADQPPAPAAPAAPAGPAGPALHVTPGQFTAQAAIAVARLQRRYGRSYTRTH